LRSLLAALALLLAIGASQAQTVRRVPGSQGWSAGTRAWMYSFTQGSQLLPYGWFRALERPDSTALFRADGLARFGYLPNPGGIDGLPVGFAIDVDRRGMWLGLNCAACHTNQVIVAGNTYQIDGGPSDTDLQGLLQELDAAMRATLADGEKFARFVGRVSATTGADPRQLRIEFAAFSARFASFVDSSRSPVPWGPARADAFGMIFNRAAAINLDLPANSRPPTAPVSFPFLWTTHNQNWIQWPGMVPNVSAFKRLGRNAGQVVGVFASMPDLADRAAPESRRFAGSVHAMELLRAEWHVAQLQPPPWVGTPPNADDVAAGRALYAQACAACHENRRDANGRYMPGRFKVAIVPLGAVGTDPLTATNIRDRRVDTSLLQGIQVLPLNLAGRFAAEDSASEYLSKLVARVILNGQSWRGLPPAPAGGSPYAPPATPDGPGISFPMPGRSESAAAALAGAEGTLFSPAAPEAGGGGAYKAGPLNGIWATGPFLHNGSVPTIWHLLQPPAERPETFEVGSRVIDEANLGFLWQAGMGRFVFDTRLPGNGNGGHLYGTGFTDAERRQMIAFLKTL
jgi:mono/diheme cytochrome c family protein